MTGPVQEVREAVAAGRVVLERRITGPAVPDFYAHRWLLDDARRRAAIAWGAIQAGAPEAIAAYVGRGA